MKARYLFLLAFALHSFGSAALEGITPCKFDKEGGIQPYKIPASSRFTTKRPQEDVPNLTYYLTKPKQTPYPIAILCEGSSGLENITSVVHFHRYFLRELLDLNLGVLTVEKWGVDGDTINQQEFMSHYTRSQRLKDHKQLIQSLIKNPPQGWNGKFVFLGVSEGGHIIEKLTEEYPDSTLATLSFSGSGDWSWQEELWIFLEKLRATDPQCPHAIKMNSCEICLKDIRSRRVYDTNMEAIRQSADPSLHFFGMTYAYHADAITFPEPDYKKIRTPFLVVTGTEDPAIESSDAFVEKAKSAGTPITYFRVEGMDHYIRKREDMQRQSFEWLRERLKKDL